MFEILIPSRTLSKLRHGSLKNYLIFLMGVTACFTKTICQSTSHYVHDSILQHSDYVQEDMRLQLHLPETFYASSATTRYPIIIIFDSQHQRTYQHIVRSLDLLTTETQIPETIIIGIPFSKHNRYYLTSAKVSQGDSLTGLQRMERFLFSELMPLLQKSYKAGDFITVIGHSRTAFLVNYLAYQHPKEIDVAIAVSGFYEENPLSVDLFATFLSDEKNFPYPFSYYYSAGTTREDSVYLRQKERLDEVLQTTAKPKNPRVQFEKNRHANHMTNYWLSVPAMLTDVFSAYNNIHDVWFHQRLENENPSDPVGIFKKDLAEASKKTGTNLLPGLTHIFSLASHYGYQKKDYAAALAFIDYGLLYYPDYLDLFVEKIGYHQLLGQKDKVVYYKKVLINKIGQNKRLSEADKKNWLAFANK